MRFSTQWILRALAIAGLLGTALIGANGPAVARASVDYGVSPSGNPPFAITYQGDMTVQDVAPGSDAAKVVCEDTDGRGTALSGGHRYLPKKPRAPYAGYDDGLRFDDVELSDCASPDGPVQVTTQNLPWAMGCTAKTTASDGSVTGCQGYLYGVDATFEAPGCTFELTGVIYGKYINKSTRFVSNTKSGLTVSTVEGPSCARIPIRPHDPVIWYGIWVYPPRPTAIHIINSPL